MQLGSLTWKSGSKDCLSFWITTLVLRLTVSSCFQYGLYQSLHYCLSVLLNKFLLNYLFCKKEWIYLIKKEFWMNLNLNSCISVCFTVFDINGDGFISREDMYTLLKNCLVKTVSFYYHNLDHDGLHSWWCVISLWFHHT